MKRTMLLIAMIAFAVMSNAQITFTINTQPCNANGIITANFTGMTTPLTVTWSMYGLTVTHTGVSTLSDQLTGWNGAQISLTVVDATPTTYYGFHAAAPPFTFTDTTSIAICPALGAVGLTITGGTAPFTYEWYTQGTSTTVLGTTNPISLASGAYDVKVTDANGCVWGTRIDSSAGYIYIPSAPAFNYPVSTTAANCTNGTASVGTILGGTPPYTYLWSNAATTSSISGLTMGSYYVTVTDANGCAVNNSAYVMQAVTINVNTTPTPATCLQSNGAITGFGSGGTPPYSYLWSNSATTQTQTGLPAGYLTLTVTDAHGCVGNGGGNILASTPITATNSVTASSCTASTGSGTLTVAGGTTPYTITWYTYPAQTGTTATGLPAGDYGFHITDNVGCVRDGTVHIPPVHIIACNFSETDATCTLSNGALAVFASGGTTPYTYLWSNSATTSSISGLGSGGYTVTVTDNSGCHVTKYAQVDVYSPVHVGISSTPASCIFNSDGSAHAVVWGGTSPYTYGWSNSSTSSTISGLHKGYYSVFVSDANGCTAHDQTYVGYNPSNNSCYCTITGTVYNDANQNCTQDVGELGLQNIQIHCSGQGYAYTDASGVYSFIVPTGSYTVSQTILGFYPLAPCQSNAIPVSVTASSGCVHTINFADTVTPIHDMHISTWDYNLPVPGNTYYQHVVISNDGTVTESAIQAGYLTDGQLPSPSFIPSTIFTGTGDYRDITSSTSPTMAPGATRPFLVHYPVPTNIPLGTNVVFEDSVAYVAPISNWLNDYSPWNNVNYFTTTTVSSYDPNFKEVSPKGTGPTGLIPYTDSVLEYMVHFQNTGTYQAQNVVVVDTLSSNLDWTTLRPIYRSAECATTIDENGVAKFTFNNINLPTATNDPITSNGMLTYTIKLKHALPVGTQIKNTASIYFDYNAPVQTNTTINTLSSATEVNTVAATENSSFTVFPNPANNIVYAVINSNGANANGYISICDLSGRVVMTKEISTAKGQQKVSVNVNTLSPGIYFVNLYNDSKVQTQKLVIMK